MLALVVMLLIGSTAVRAQQAAATGVISGVVVDGLTGAPVPGAVVFVAAVPTKPIGQQPRQITDERGRFAFVDLPADTVYTVASSKFGYLEGGYGRDTRPADPLRSIALASGAWVRNIRATIWKPGVISGTVRDESGEPVVGVYVRALAKIRIYGRNDLAAGPIVVTDDRGEYRFADLGPGSYLVQVPSVQATVPVHTPLGRNTAEGAIDVDDNHRLVLNRYPVPPPPVNGRQMAYAAAFHPSTPVVEQAAVIDLKYAEDRPNVDIRLKPVATARVSGTIAGPPDALTGLTLRLLPVGLENLGLGSEMAMAFVRPDGSFTFLNVPAGSYVIEAPNTVSQLTVGDGVSAVVGTTLPGPPTATGSGRSGDTIGLLPGVSYVRSSFGRSAAYSARVPVTVAGSDVTGVSLRLLPHATMSGRIVVEPDPGQPQVKPPPRFPVRLDPATGEAHLGFGASPPGSEQPPPAFAITDITPGQYYVRPYGYPGWIVKSVTWRDRDVTHTPFEAAAGEAISDVVVTITNVVTQVSGAVRDGDTLKADAAIVVLFPVERSQWTNAGLWPERIKTVPLSAAGTYSVTSAPAGDYFVAAIDRSQIAGWMDPAFLTRLERVATRVTLTWGGKTSQDLTVAVVR